MQKQKWILLGFSILVLVAVGIGVYFQRSSHRFERPKKRAHIQPSFVPSQVKVFEWDVGREKMSFRRSNPTEAWSPLPPSPEDIEQRLQDLSETEYGAIESDSNPLVKIGMETTDGAKWIGFWDGRLFFWKMGPLAGKGFYTDTPYLQGIFAPGQFAFSKRKINWCMARIQQISIQSRDLELRLYRDAAKWMLSRRGLRELDPSSVENWFGKNCAFQADHFIDPSIVPKSELNLGGVIEVQFENKLSSKLAKRDHESIFSNGRFFRSTTFQNGLIELSSLPSAAKR